MRPHIPVLLYKAIQGLQVAPGKRFIDATYGGGGHAVEIVRRGGDVLTIDADPDTQAMVIGNFRDIETIAKAYGFMAVDGILFDLGVSSHQLDTPQRGFSYRFPNEKLDMRFTKKGETARDLLAHVSEDALYEILAKFGEVERARELARAIVRSRPVTTDELLHSVGKRDAPQVFQAIRIAVNDELGALKAGLIGAKTLLKTGGRLVVITFHSLEDRMVKQFMSDWKMVTKKPIIADVRELETNPRARSAKLRIAEKQ